MIEIIIIVILISALLTFYRVIKGPTLFDRIAAADSIGIMFLLVLVLLSIYFQRQIFIDVAIVYALLLFVDVLIMAKFFGR
ncbi:multicomponent Na+:H+ antiporter subunit F [Orenia metallireducens]|jgi:multicomponent Na+:H+ antiporter subunit F|uniref:Multicomponent Na+:H+ antiporter subunit F n=1 Tax=Orenia metallireducens TaxID=1413210 RepID=A0A285HPJ5_9FIRM|nr:monovalent cation/H+ antiporter complex subunit F [Orenia metallireducens]PRX27958.1 multicomponent Na+:H+ antiporter subunit F [Orenia metallireducens]SNY37648.1 multicomponent Na+:H+ antiporter subunit F [Orenia metallireducens]